MLASEPQGAEDCHRTHRPQSSRDSNQQVHPTNHCSGFDKQRSNSVYHKRSAHLAKCHATLQGLCQGSVHDFLSKQRGYIMSLRPRTSALNRLVDPKLCCFCSEMGSLTLELEAERGTTWDRGMLMDESGLVGNLTAGTVCDCRAGLAKLVLASLNTCITTAGESRSSNGCSKHVQASLQHLRQSYEPSMHADSRLTLDGKSILCGCLAGYGELRLRTPFLLLLNSRSASTVGPRPQTPSAALAEWLQVWHSLVLRVEPQLPPVAQHRRAIPPVPDGRCQEQTPPPISRKIAVKADAGLVL